MQLPNSKYFLLSVPEPHILLLTINRPKQLNSLNPEANREMDSLLDWAEENDDIWCIIVIGYMTLRSLSHTKLKHVLYIAYRCWEQSFLHRHGSC